MFLTSIISHQNVTIMETTQKKRISPLSQMIAEQLEKEKTGKVAVSPSTRSPENKNPAISLTEGELREWGEFAMVCGLAWLIQIKGVELTTLIAEHLKSRGIQPPVITDPDKYQILSEYFLIKARSLAAIPTPHVIPKAHRVKRYFYPYFDPKN